jgi:type I restriction enzyme S subunit
MKNVAISDLTEINPKTNLSRLTLDDLVSFIPMTDVSESGEWKHKQAAPLRNLRTGFTAFQDGDVLFAKITPCMENGKGAHAVGLENGVGFGSTEFHVLRARSGVLDRFVFHWSQSPDLRVAAEAQMSGSAGQRRVPTDFFGKFLVPGFSPKEQCRIAEILDTVDEAIRTTERLIEKLKVIKAGLLHDLLTRGIDENGRLRDPIAHPEQFRDSKLSLIPKSWTVRPLSSYIIDLEAGVSVNSLDRPARAGELGVLKTSSVFQGSFIPGENKAILRAEYSRVRINPRADSVIISRMNTPDLVGENAYVWETRSDLYLPDRLWQTVRSPSESFSMKWLSYTLQSPAFKSRMRVFTGGTSGSMKNLSKQSFLALQLATPQIEEQEEIARRLEAHDSAIRAETDSKHKLVVLKRGLMHDLLTGKVRVSIDEEDDDE